MLYLYGVVVIACVALLVLGVREQRRHDRNLDAVPVRVLVNGTRGKSSVTRLIAGALRGGLEGQPVGGAGVVPEHVRAVPNEP